MSPASRVWSLRHWTTEEVPRLESVYMCLDVSHSVTPWTVAHQAPMSMGLSPGKNTGVYCHFHLQGIFPTQGSNPHFLHCGQSLYRVTREAP